jgi:1-acyl-sn-glycerol-3-phosphate acyltransferase
MARIKPYAILPWIIQRGVWIPCRIIFKFFFKLKIYGLENLRMTDKLLIASNHISQFDPVLIPASLPFFSKLLPVYNISRDKTFYSDSIFQKFFYGGLLFEILGSYSVKVGINNYEISLSRHVDLLNNNNVVVIFPEGKISIDGELSKAKNGLGYLAYVTKSKVLPVKIIGLHNVKFTDIILRKREVIIRFGKPINIDNFSYNNMSNIEIYKFITDIVMRRIKFL